MIKITENLDKAKFEMLKAHVVNVLSAPEKWVATKDRSRMVTHWGRKWEFECESDTECFTTESIFDAVDWLYAEQDPYKEESKPESEVKFSAEVIIQVTDEYIDKAKREAQIEVLKGVKKFHDTEAKLFGSTYMKLLHKGEIDDEYQGLANAHTRSSVAVQGLIDELEKRGE